MQAGSPELRKAVENRCPYDSSTRDRKAWFFDASAEIGIEKTRLRGLFYNPDLTLHAEERAKILGNRIQRLRIQAEQIKREAKELRDEEKQEWDAICQKMFGSTSQVVA